MRKPKQIKIKTLLGQPHDDDGDDNDDIDDDDNDDDDCINFAVSQLLNAFPTLMYICFRATSGIGLNGLEISVGTSC